MLESPNKSALRNRSPSKLSNPRTDGSSAGPKQQAFFEIPDGWKPGDNFIIRDPNDPSKKLEIPASAINAKEQKPMI